MTKNLIIADTGFWYAPINQDDYFHARAVAALENVDGAMRQCERALVDSLYQKSHLDVLSGAFVVVDETGVRTHVAIGGVV